MLPAPSLILLALWLAILFKPPQINEKHGPGEDLVLTAEPNPLDVCVSRKQPWSDICPFNRWENQQI